MSSRGGWILLKRRFIEQLVMLGLLATPLFAQEQKESDRFQLKAVSLVGIQSVSKEELAKTLAARIVDGWKFWKPLPVLSASDLEEDLLRIKQFYQRFGYYHASAAYRMDVETGREADAVGSPPPIRVTFTVEEGVPVRVRSIALRLSQPVEGVTEHTLLERFPLKEKAIFETGRYQDGKRALATVFNNQGYPFAKVDGRVTVNLEENAADINLSVEPRRFSTFGPVKISGNDGYVRDIVIHRAMRFKKGDTYRRDRVEQSQRNLFELDVFKAALIKPGEPAPDDDEVPMEVQVKPKKRQSVKFGVGYGNEDGLRLKGAWSYRNLWGWAGIFSMSARRSDLVENIQGSYSQPYFGGEKNTLLSNAGVEREKLDSYNSRSFFANAFFDRQLEGSWRGRAGYKLDVSEIEVLKTTAPEEIRNAKEENNFFISSGLLGFSLNTVDNEIDPTRGSFFSVSGELASSVLGSELDYFQPAVEFKTYYPLLHKTILAGRIRFETKQKTEDTDFIPINKRLFLGGTNTVRGYGYQKLGPLDVNKNPLGGLASILGNIELRFPIIKQVSGVVFVDMGLLDEDPLSFENEDMRFTSGLGIRYNTLIGPIRLDFGYKLNPPKLSDVSRAASDEEIEDRWQIHFSIGQAF